MATPPRVNASIIQLTPASAAFVENRTTTLGSWVLAGFLDSILMGVVLCQLATFAKGTGVHRGPRSSLQKLYLGVVICVTLLSFLKTAQAIAIVWMQNVHFFADPDRARTLVATAWWQVTMPLLTATIGCIVQSCFCTRFYMLSQNWMYCVPIVCAMCVGLTGGCLSVYSIVAGHAHAKVMWLMIHLVGVFIADLLITAGTIYTLRRRASGLPRTTLLLHRLLRMVFESAVPPCVSSLHINNLILTQTLGPKRLLWHLFVNAGLGKIYVISLLYTLNCVHEYREQDQQWNPYSYTTRRNSRPNNDIELCPRGTTKSTQITLQSEDLVVVTPITTSPPSVFPRVQETRSLKTSSYISEDFVHTIGEVTSEEDIDIDLESEKRSRQPDA
ncbi:hypothetical protein C8R43DRAFT_264439 [Mycena crocata]|nr:hypothetical protein C8R43DRAFT_264439 [Mycena crocata]